MNTFKITPIFSICQDSSYKILCFSKKYKITLAGVALWRLLFCTFFLVDLLCPDITLADSLHKKNQVLEKIQILLLLKSKRNWPFIFWYRIERRSIMLMPICSRRRADVSIRHWCMAWSSVIVWWTTVRICSPLWIYIFFNYWFK